MNDHDKSNLQFIMSLSPSELADWYECLDEDDIQYAFELIHTARAEIEMSAATLFDEPENLDLANKVLSKFRLSK